MVISRAERDVQEKFLLRNGADKVVYPEKMVAKWATIRYTDDHILDYMEVDASHAVSYTHLYHIFMKIFYKTTASGIGDCLIYLMNKACFKKC